MTNLIILTVEEFEERIERVLEKHENNKKKLRSEKLFTINQVAKRTCKSHATIKKYVNAGIIKANQVGLISETAINDFLKTK